MPQRKSSTINSVTVAISSGDVVVASLKQLRKTLAKVSFPISEWPVPPRLGNINWDRKEFAEGVLTAQVSEFTTLTQIPPGQADPDLWCSRERWAELLVSAMVKKLRASTRGT